MAQEISGLDEVSSLLEKLVTYTKLANYHSIRNRLMQILDSEEKRRVFETTDEKNTVRDIEAITGVSIGTISRWWSEWEKEGIVEESRKVRGRRYKVLSLTDFGVEIPGGKRQKAERH